MAEKELRAPVGRLPAEQELQWFLFAAGPGGSFLLRAPVDPWPQDSIKDAFVRFARLRAPQSRRAAATMFSVVG